MVRYDEETLKAFCKELAKGNKNSKPKAHGILAKARKEHHEKLPTTQAIVLGVLNKRIRR